MKLNIKSILIEAWHHTKGAKKQYWLTVTPLFIAALLVYLLIGEHLEPAIIVYFNRANHIGGQTFNTVIILLVHTFATSFLLTPLLSSLMRIGIAQALQQNDKITSVFSDYRFVLPLGIAYFSWLATFLFIIFFPSFMGITETVNVVQNTSQLSAAIFAFFLFSRQIFIPLISIDQMGVLKAFILARKKVRYYWFELSILSLVSLLLVFASLFSLGIGLLWSLPMVNNIKGIIYRELFIDKNTAIDLKDTAKLATA